MTGEEQWIEYRAEGDDFVPMEKWGRDHWSTLVYLETRAVDAGGRIDNRRMRCNPRLHRELANLRDASGHPTILRDGEELEGHDDWSCLEDMVAASVLRAWFRVKYPGEIFGSTEAMIELTELGWRLVGQTRAHRAAGGKYSGFRPELSQGGSND